MKIMCIGRNYADHARELQNPVPERPLVFMKPSSALLVNNKPLYYPDFTKDLHHEVEIVLKITRNGRHVQPEFAHRFYDSVAIGIDFTARDLQSELKAKGHPWEIAKGFDGSAAISQFVPLAELKDSENIHFSLTKNGETVQRGITKDLLFSFDTLIAYLSIFFKLQVGDYIYTGTPAGVGPVQIGDRLEAFIEDRSLLTCAIR